MDEKAIRIRQLRTELAFLYSDQCQGKPVKEQEMVEIRKQIAELEEKE